MQRQTRAIAAIGVAAGLALLWFWPNDEQEREPSPASPALESAAAPPRASAELVVRVVAAGQPLSGARVFVQVDQPGPLRIVASGASGQDGVARLSQVPQGSWQLVVTHAELAKHRRKLELIAERVELEVALEKGVRIEGSVLDSQKRPIAEASVRALTVGSDAEHARTLSDARGHFLILGLDPGSYRLYAHSGRHRPRYEGPLEFSAHGQSRRVEIVLEAGLTLSGQVVDAARKPIPAANVGAADEGSPLVKTDEHGRFELAGLGGQPVNVFATSPGYGPTHLTGVRPGGRNLEIVLERAARLDGSVALAVPSNKMMVSLCRHEERTDDELCVARRLYEPAEARFSLEELPIGKFEVVIEAEGHRTARVPVRLSPGQNFTVPLVSLTQGAPAP